MLGKGATRGRQRAHAKNQQTEALLTLHTVTLTPWQEIFLAEVAKLSGWHDKMQHRIGTPVRYLIWSICLCPQRKRNLRLQIFR